MEGLLLGLGFIGLVMVILTPQSKLGALMTLLSFGAYFVLVGVTDWFPIILFMFGIGLVIIELFIPGFGLSGILGTVILSGGLYWSLGDIGQTIRDLSLALLLTGIVIVILIRNGYSFQNLSKLVLHTNLSSEKGASFASLPQNELIVGMIGKSITPLRPSGKAVFDTETDLVLDVLSDSDLIPTGSRIEIKKIIGSKIIVRSVDHYV